MTASHLPRTDFPQRVPPPTGRAAPGGRQIRPAPHRFLSGPAGRIPIFDNAQGRTPEEVQDVGERLIQACGFAVTALVVFKVLPLVRLLWRVPT